MFSEIHNTVEDTVFASINEICAAIEKEGRDDICTCPQCRRDAVCYVLNQTVPRYVVSNRGVARAEQGGSIKQQQDIADITALIYEGIKRVAHNQRKTANHSARHEDEIRTDAPVYNIPTIIGRLFNGINFEPMAGVNVELRLDGDLVAMKDNNWQNPYTLVANTEGTFAFWPEPVPVDSKGERKNFEYSIHVEVSGFETLNHFFKIPMISDLAPVKSYSMTRTFKLPDLYMFPPGEDANIGLRDDLEFGA
ncbi:MAG: late competence development ComFB family protein [Treponema sp.]|jgi:competence protein ComFB|nr:late competence development ComFB family protein [Treponema sp.]